MTIVGNLECLRSYTYSVLVYNILPNKKAQILNFDLSVI